MDNKTIRSLAAQFGFHDQEHAGELARIFDGPGRRRRYLRRSGLSLDEFGEVLFDRGLCQERPRPDDVYQLLDQTFCTDAAKRKQRAPSRATVRDAERKARQMRLRKYVCDSCQQIARGTRNSVLICGLCHEMHGEIVTMRRVDPLPEEIAMQGGVA